jgi:predicted Zn-dependent protease
LHESYQLQKQTAMAVEKVKEYAAREPKSAPVQDFLGTILLARGNAPAARSAFEAAKAADSDSRQADLKLIQVDLFEGKVDRARQQLQAFVSSNPGDATGHLWLANVEATKGNFKTAVEQYRAVVAAEPDNAEALNNLAYGLAEYGGNSNEALKFAQRARSLRPIPRLIRILSGGSSTAKGSIPQPSKRLSALRVKAETPSGITIWPRLVPRRGRRVELGQFCKPR